MLRENHARVLDFFRKIDTNFDGAISKGEMAYALHSLGLNASPKEVDALFMSFDPSGDGVIEFSELQHALVHGVSAGTARPKKLTKAQRERLRQENCNHTWEFEEMVHAFERCMSARLDPPLLLCLVSLTARLDPPLHPRLLAYSPTRCLDRPRPPQLVASTIPPPSPRRPLRR